MPPRPDPHPDSQPDRRLQQHRGSIPDALVELAIHEHRTRVLPRLDRMWSYYRNALEPAGFGDSLSSTRGRWYRQAQEVGLPPRITGAGTALSATFGASGPTAFDDRARARREVVVENDIAWRIHAMVDFMFGKPATVVSTARDQALRALIDPIIDAVWENSGGIGLLQDAALLGHVYGHVDFLVRVDPDLHLARADDPASIARCISIEIIDPTRGIPILDPSDYRRLIGYIVHLQRARAVDAAGRGPRSPYSRRTGAFVEAVHRRRTPVPGSGRAKMKGGGPAALPAALRRY